jgi:hypothetical protein
MTPILSWAAYASLWRLLPVGLGWKGAGSIENRALAEIFTARYFK